MKKKLLKSVNKPSAKVQELQTVVIIALVVAMIVMSAVVAVLLARVSNQSDSIDDLYMMVTDLKN